jgi:WhiB family redox-sensing transcriptional regulator
MISRRVTGMESSVMSSASTDWRDLAACRYEDPDLFFPMGHSPATERQINQAKAICAICPVLDTCLQFARDEQMEYGIFGGKDEFERRGKNRTIVHPPQKTLDPARLLAVKGLMRDGHSESEMAVILRCDVRTIARYKARIREAA